MNSVVEDIKSRINIVDFIGQYLRLQKAGANWKALCPFHSEKTPSFMVHEEKQIWHCFGCGKGGDIFDFLMQMEALDFKEALKILAEKAGVELPKINKFAKENFSENKNKIIEILELSARFYEIQLWKGSGKVKILEYLRGRGLKDEVIKNFRIGYAPLGWRNLFDFLLKRGYDIKDITKTGLLVEKSKEILKSELQTSNFDYYDRFRDRITFPITDVLGKIVGFSARVAPGGDESQAKYVNTPETVVYHKSKILYGIDKAKKFIKEKNEVILVEGNTDVMAAHQIGVKNTVAVSGTALTSEQLDILRRYTLNLKMFFDMDSAGQSAAFRSTELALEKGFNVYIIESSAGKDAAEIISRDSAVFTLAVSSAKPAVEYFLEKIFSKYDKNNSIDKKKIATESLGFLKHIENVIERDHWLKILAENLNIEFKIIADNLNQLISRDKSFVKKPASAEIIFKPERLKVIAEKIIGLMLAYPVVWKTMLEKYFTEPALSDRKDFQFLVEKGQECNFEVDKLFFIMEDKDLEKTFRKISFENRYQFSEGTKVAELDSEKALELALVYIAELRKEEIKRRMKNISLDLEKAEKEGNQEAIRLLTKEFSDLSNLSKNL